MSARESTRAGTASRRAGRPSPDRHICLPALPLLGSAAWASPPVLLGSAGPAPALSVSTVSTPARGQTGRRPAAQFPSWPGSVLGSGEERPEAEVMRGWRGGRGFDRACAGRGWAGIRRAGRAIPARVAGALLPNSGLGGRRRGRVAGNAASRLAGTGCLRRAFLDPDLAVPGRHQPLPERVAFG